MNPDTSKYIVLMLAYGFFIVCPRMAAMTNMIARNFELSIYWLVILGTFFSIPLLVVMCWIIQKWGLTAGLGFAVLTDFLSALILTSVDIRVAIETLIIAIFVVAGNRIAVWITSRFIG